MGKIDSICVKIRKDIMNLLRCRTVLVHILKQDIITATEARMILGYNRMVYRNIEELCAVLTESKEICTKENVHQIKFLSGKIIAELFLSIDEIIYAQFPRLVPNELKDDENVYVLSRMRRHESFEIWKSKLVGMMNDLANSVNYRQECSKNGDDCESCCKCQYKKN